MTQLEAINFSIDLIETRYDAADPESMRIANGALIALDKIKMRLIKEKAGRSKPLPDTRG